MRSAIWISAAVVALATLSCRRAAQPFTCTFEGDRSGSGYVMVDRLSGDRNAGIVVRIDLVPQKGSGFEAKYLHRLRDEGSLHLAIKIGSTDPAATVHVYEFTNAVSGFTWHHGNFMAEAGRVWEAESGDIALDLRRIGSASLASSATVSLSHVVFKTTGSRQKRWIDQLTIPDVEVGGMRL